MVAGHLQEKKGIYYVVLNYNDEFQKRKTKWISTGLHVKGNKKRAEAMLLEYRRTFKPVIPLTTEILFADYMIKWLEIAKNSIELVTYASYSTTIKSIIVPYFRKLNITLSELEAKHIQDFYTEQLKRVKASSVIHYHANIHKALKYAVKTDLIASNPASKVDRPKMEKFVGGFYSSDELNKLFEVSKGGLLEIPILLASIYGLRRSEVIGLKWDAIDFENNTIAIRHTVTTCHLDGKNVIVVKDKTKNLSSLRTLPLVPEIKEKLIEHKEKTLENKRLCGRSYCHRDLDYICVNEIGERMKPNYLTSSFPELLNKHDLRRIRFHDLRHSCASLLLANGIPMKQIQDWLGHADFSTTANIYAHLDYNSKITSATALLNSVTIKMKEFR